MKKNYSLFLSVLFLPAFLIQGNAQSLIEVSGTSPLSLNSKTLITGGGAGVGFYGAPIQLVKPAFKKESPLNLRFGGSFYYNGAGHRSFSNVPLINGTGTAKAYFSNSLMGINTGVKLSSSIFKGNIIPYAEAYFGLRYFSSDLSITPDIVDEKSNYQTITKTSGMHIGATGGMMFRLSDSFFIDTGVMWSHSELNGEYVDLQALKRIGTSIGYQTEKLPNDFLVFKLGVTGYIGEADWASSGGHRSGDGWCDFLEDLFDGIGSGGGGGGNIGLIKF